MYNDRKVSTIYYEYKAVTKQHSSPIFVTFIDYNCTCSIIICNITLAKLFFTGLG